MTNSISENFTFLSSDKTGIMVYKWIPVDQEPKGVVQISHGMAETAARYERFAKVLNGKGFIVYANDHRGHGKTAASIDELGYLGEKGSFKLLVEDLATVSDRIKKENPGLPIYLFSHSMGSFAAQRYIMNYPDKINGLILSGSNGEQGLPLKAGKWLVKLAMLVKGRKAKSEFVDSLIFGGFNKKFYPKKTGYEWLTRDADELAKYVNDLYCGTLFPISFYDELIENLEHIEDKETNKKIPQNLPIVILSGAQDPVGDFGEGVKKLYKRYEVCGVKDLEMKLYEGARHEILNETNRDEVMKDIIEWLEKRIG
ncbi:alpha/beta hydrolase [Carnobacterium iners]|nr:alpha/beta hydrolase [Carnobacterium iners]